MFRNPRENRQLPGPSQISPSVGRSPSPPRSDSTSEKAAAMAAKSTPMSKSLRSQPRQTQTTLVPSDWGKKSANSGFKGKPKATPNGNIITFFKKVEEQNNKLFLQECSTSAVSGGRKVEDEYIGWTDTNADAVIASERCSEGDERYNENGGSFKRRRVSEQMPVKSCTPPLPDYGEEVALKAPLANAAKIRRTTGPFLDDSESETEDTIMPVRPRGIPPSPQPPATFKYSKLVEEPTQTDSTEKRLPPTNRVPPLLKAETTSQMESQDFDEFEGLDGEFLEGEEYDERRWTEEQRRLEMAEAGFEADVDDANPHPMFPDDEDGDVAALKAGHESVPSCPICNAELEGLNGQEATVHVNACLDGNPIPLPTADSPLKMKSPAPDDNRRVFKTPPIPAKETQTIPFKLGETGRQPNSAFSKLMANNVEDAAWATAAASEHSARGKLSYQRTCPFYKILPGFYVCVDAFRYGAVKGQNAYFLSHFHSDHYIGLTSSWAHGPIYCSKVTGNLVRQQLRVDPKWVIDLDFEKKTEVPGTECVHVTMIPANHCPGSSLFLFEKEVGRGKNARVQRVLHCGDFRACQAHIEHPLLKPNVLDAVSGKNRQQKLDVCYLDTTYLNPKYAFPPQHQVIQACADMCVNLSNTKPDGSGGWDQLRGRAGQGMIRFGRKVSETKEQIGDVAEVVNVRDITVPGSARERGRLLVVVGTYSIGKERICIGIAKALKSRIYAPPNKQRICHALEDPELDALLTKDPLDAQVHMTPLFEIRAETLEDYLGDYRDHFSRVVGFRPSGWNYRPPNGRFTESPTVQTVLHSQNWKSHFSMQDLVPQRGSTSRASCFGVPYSEHSSFRELTMFCCALRIDKIIPTVNVGSAKSREKMKAWCEKWKTDQGKNGLFRLAEGGSGW